MIESLLGRIGTLTILRRRPPGAYLAIDPEDQRDEADGILLPGAEVPEGAKAGDDVEVFVIHAPVDGEVVRDSRSTTAQASCCTSTTLGSGGAAALRRRASSSGGTYAVGETILEREQWLSAERAEVGVFGELADPLIGLRRRWEDALDTLFAAAVQRFGSVNAAPSSAH